MQCSKCGHHNKAGTSFCAECLSPLSERQVQLKQGDRVIMPPQNEHIVELRSTARSHQGSRSGWWIIVWLIIILIILVLVYG